MYEKCITMEILDVGAFKSNITDINYLPISSSRGTNPWAATELAETFLDDL